MTPEELVEIVARAQREGWRDLEGLRAETLEWGDIETEERAQWMHCTLAALRAVRDALREPDEGMIDAGWIDKEDVDPDDIWRAMLETSPLGRIDDA